VSIRTLRVVCADANADRAVISVRATLDAAEAIFAPALALRVDPDAPAGDDPYADPQYQVPDDLVW
jgi:uncharacterized protein YaiL (DUF2058 family)